MGHFITGVWDLYSLRRLQHKKNFYNFTQIVL